MLKYIILYYSLFIAFPIGVYSLPYIFLGLLSTTHSISIYRGLLKYNHEQDLIQCSPLFSSAHSLFYILFQYISHRIKVTTFKLWNSSQPTVLPPVNDHST
jgi:hypothetical protein